MATPLVSVIVPAYEAAGHIATAVESVVAQTFRDYELLVVNDGSPDTPRLEAAIASQRNRLRYIVQSKRGAAAARNVGILAARGSLVAFLDADDCWHPHYLEEQVSYLNSHPDVALVFADAVLAGDSPLAGRTFMETAPSRGVSLLDLLSLDCHIPTSGVMVRRSALLDTGLFDESLSRGHDFDLWLRLAQRGNRLAGRPVVLLTLKRRSGSLSGDTITQYSRVIEVLRRTLASLDLSPRERAAATRSIAIATARLMIHHAKASLAAGDVTGARDQTGRALELHWRPKWAALRLALRVCPSLLCRAATAAGRLDGAMARRVRQSPSRLASISVNRIIR